MSDLDQGYNALAVITDIEWDFDDDLNKQYVDLVRVFLKNCSAVVNEHLLTVHGPFFDICCELGIDKQMPPNAETKMAHWLSQNGSIYSLPSTICAWHVKACFCSKELSEFNMVGQGYYAPLIEVFKAGGFFYIEHGFITIGMAGIPIYHWLKEVKNH